MGRRPSVVLACLAAAAATSLGGYLADVHIGSVSMFYVMVLLHGFFGNYAIVGPYMAEVWPA